jgi:hypothetical protein
LGARPATWLINTISGATTPSRRDAAETVFNGRGAVDAAPSAVPAELTPAADAKAIKRSHLVKVQSSKARRVEMGGKPKNQAR